MIATQQPLPATGPRHAVAAADHSAHAHMNKRSFWSITAKRCQSDAIDLTTVAFWTTSLHASVKLGLFSTARYRESVGPPRFECLDLHG